MDRKIFLSRHSPDLIPCKETTSRGFNAMFFQSSRILCIFKGGVITIIARPLIRVFCHGLFPTGISHEVCYQASSFKWALCPMTSTTSVDIKSYGLDEVRNTYLKPMTQTKKEEKKKENERTELSTKTTLSA